MVFVKKTLEQMLKEIEARPDNKITHEENPKGPREILTYQKKYERVIEHNLDPRHIEKVKQNPDYNGRIKLSIAVVLLENSVYRGYKLGKVARPVEINYFFGEKGMVMQVKDEGQGFWPEKIIESFENKKQERGKDYFCGGWGMKTMQRPEFETSIKSKPELEKGTEVNVMYKY